MWRVFMWACVWACACAYAETSTSDIMRYEKSQCYCEDMCCGVEEFRCWIYVKNKYWPPWKQEMKTVNLKMTSEHLYMNCDKWAAFDSPAMLSFRSTLRVASVTLVNCPPPGAGRSYAEALTALNVTLLQTENQGNLSLEWEEWQTQPLAAHHFIGLEHLVELKLSKLQVTSPARIFTKLRSLRSLHLNSVHLPNGEFDELPASLRHLYLKNTYSEQVEAVLKLTDLETVDLIETYNNRPLEFAISLPKLRRLFLQSGETKMQLVDTMALESLYMSNWMERRPVALTQCEALRELELWHPSADTLPERWVAACPNLERLKVSYTNYLTALPPKLLAGATGLTGLSINDMNLATLPVGLFDDLLNLRKLDLKGNHLQKLPSGVFAKLRALQTLVLSDNDLETDVVDEVVVLHNLTELFLGHNTRIGDACDSSGYSHLLELNKLKTLSLSQTSITRICCDWRENMTLLETLDLTDTRIKELWFNDLQFTRDDNVNASIYFGNTPITSMKFTEDDYEKSLTAPKSRTKFSMYGTNLNCDCDMYWTWLTLGHKNNTINIPWLKCSDGRYLTSLTEDELCPGRPES